jgi:hypothetical protein
MKNQHNHSIEDIIKNTDFNNKKNKNINIKNFIFREYEKKDGIFIAKNNFYLSEEVDGNFEFKKIYINSILNSNENIKIYNEKIIPYSNNNIYIYTDISDKKINDNKSNIFINKYIDLILISNISFSLYDINIDKSEIIKKIIESDDILDERLFEDLYYNNYFSKKINIELPKKYNNKKVILEDINISKKYLFKINFLEMNDLFEKEENILI